MALEFIPREGLVVLQKKRLEHLKEKETGNENGRFWPKCVRDVAKACPRDVPGSPLGKLLEGSVKLKTLTSFAIRSSKLAADGRVTAARLFEKLLRSDQLCHPFSSLRTTSNTSRRGAVCILLVPNSLPSCLLGCLHF